MKKMRYYDVQLFSRLQRYYKELVVCIVVSLLCFCMIALITFHAHDQSLFYYQTKSTAVHNAGGWLGAHIAGLLLYLFGMLGSYTVLAVMSFLVILYWCHTSLYRQWERIVSSAFFILLVCLWAAVYQKDMIHHTVPGGKVGIAFHGWLSHFFDDICLIVFLYSFLIITSLLLLRFPFISSISFARKCTWIYKPIFAGFYYLYKAAVWIKNYIYSTLRGTSIEQSRATVLDYDEYDDTHEIQLDDFWYSIGNQTNVHTQKEHENYTRTMHDFSESTAEPVHEYSRFEPSEIKQQKIDYQLPNLSIFIGVKQEQDDGNSMRELEANALILQEKLERFGVYGTVTAIKRGPVVTLFEYQPEIDTKISKIIALEDDLALALQALSIRIIAPIPGRSVVGFEVANAKRKSVTFASLIRSCLFDDFSGALPLILGEDTSGSPVFVDLARMPHLLIAGSTGSGKSVALNTMLMSLLCKQTPDELRLILIDPKRLEFAPYADIPHLLFPIVTDAKKAILVLRWVVKQMEERYERMAEYGARNIFDYHEQQRKQQLPDMPFIVVVIDELSDLMMLAGKDIEEVITRIAQMARASGIHLIVATQRPSVDVITGLIKVNFPSRISFRVTSKIDSRTILDCAGADKLLGKGDMLFMDSSSALLKRVHGAYVSDGEIDRVVAHIKSERAVQYQELEEIPEGRGGLFEGDDTLYKEVIEHLQMVDEVSISSLQRQFRIGYNRSARIISMLEQQGLILPADGSKTRKVIR